MTKTKRMTKTIVDNQERKQFEMTVDGYTAFSEYILTKKGVIYLTHTEVPKNIEGRGIAFEMIRQILENIEERQLKLMPLCPLVATFIRRHPEWKRLLAPHVNV